MIGRYQSVDGSLKKTARNPIVGNKKKTKNMMNLNNKMTNCVDFTKRCNE